MLKKALISAAILSISSTAVLAADTNSASIARMDGNVMVNQGESFQTGHQGMSLKQGDRIMIMDGAELSLSYSDGCNFTFKESQIIQIGDVSVCASNGTGFVKATSPMYVQSAPGVEGQKKAAAPPPESGALAWTAGIAAGAAVIYYATKDDDNEASQ